MARPLPGNYWDGAGGIYVGAILFKGGNVATDARWTAILSGDVGWSTKGVFGHRGAWGGQLFLNKLYIDTREQGRGLGQAIWQNVLLLLSDLREMRLQVNRQNYKAINFYFKVGFVIERVADFDIGDGYFMNDFVMLYRR